MPGMHRIVALALLALVPAALAQEARTVTIAAAKDEAIAAFLDRAAELIGKPLLYDPNNQRVRGQSMGADIEWTVKKGQELDLVRSVLVFYELTLVPVGPTGHEFFLVLDSRSTNNYVKQKAVFVDYEQLAAYEDKDGLYIATAIPVRHVENLTTLRTALSTMVSPAGIGRVHEVPGSGSILLMDFAPTVVAMTRMIRQIDVEPEKVLTETIRLQHVEAGPLAATLRELFTDEPPKPAPGRQAPPPSSPTRIAAYAPANAVVVMAAERELARIRQVIQQLDVRPE